ncbi:glycosyltransferase family 2 protein [Paraglaciecola aestuariivivens]
MLKKIAKKILGKPSSARQPYTIDIVTPTPDGFTVAGWYFDHAYTDVAITDLEGKRAKFTSQTLERLDVLAATGKKAHGFTLNCFTTESVADFKLEFSSNTGQKTAVEITSKDKEKVLADFANLDASDTAHSAFKAVVETALYDQESLFLSGWVLDSGNLQSVSFEDGGSTYVAEAKDILRYGRNDVAEAFVDEAKSTKQHGLTLRIALDEPIPERRLKKIKITFKVNEQEASVSLPKLYTLANNPVMNVKRVMHGWNIHNKKHLDLCSTVIQPLVKNIFPADKTTASTRVDFGRVDNPKATVIIPLYGRYDFMRYQLSNFSRFGSLKDYEVLYVVDDPKIANAVNKLAIELSIVFSQPFSVITLAENMGFGGANNIGVKHANSDKLILLNSDVLPKDSEWANKMIAQIDKAANIGVVGARLLFEDNSIQHDGMAPMQLKQYPGLLLNDHPNKGWPISLSKNKAEVADCPLLTAACIAISKSLYEQVGGFDPAYVLGDFEDSDLCLKVLEAGKRNVICRDVELNHLERQSQNLVEAGDWKHKLTIYNAITYNQRWAAKLNQLFDLGKGE